MTERTIAQCFLCGQKHDVTGSVETKHTCPACGGNCSVYISRQMSPEELAKYGPAVPARQKISAPRVFDLDEQRKRAKQEEMRTMQHLSGPANGKTNIDYLKARAEGSSILAIEKSWGMKLNTLSFWLGKWGLKGVSPDRAKQILEEAGLYAKKYQPAKETVQQTGDGGPSDPRVKGQTGESQDGQGTGSATDETVADGGDGKQVYQAVGDDGTAATHEEIRRGPLREEIDRLKAANAEVVALAGKAAEQQQAEIERLRHVLEEREDRILLLSTIERSAAADPVANDPVNHPAHYTAGAVECIDAIESATVGLAGGQAYITGAVIKYMWRWSRKGGAEDLRKAEWYMRRLIDSVDEEASHDAG